ncbi:MAG: hypothetical protein KGJ86_05595 [Chloroflexota bacterium]|nr:hypothetical protein [Chloroflexota bacterium]
MTRPDNSVFLRAAEQRRRTEMLERTLKVIQQLAATGGQITYAGLASAAGVSRAWLYHQPQVQAAVEAARADVRARHRRPTREAASDASKDARIRVLLEDNQALRAEVTALKAKLAELLGELREHQQGRR